MYHEYVYCYTIPTNKTIWQRYTNSQLRERGERCSCVSKFLAVHSSSFLFFADAVYPWTPRVKNWATVMAVRSAQRPNCGSSSSFRVNSARLNSFILGSGVKNKDNVHVAWRGGRSEVKIYRKRSDSTWKELASLVLVSFHTKPYMLYDPSEIFTQVMETRFFFSKGLPKQIHRL